MWNICLIFTEILIGIKLHYKYTMASVFIRIVCEKYLILYIIQDRNKNDFHSSNDTIVSFVHQYFEIIFVTIFLLFIYIVSFIGRIPNMWPAIVMPLNKPRKILSHFCAKCILENFSYLNFVSFCQL